MDNLYTIDKSEDFGGYAFATQSIKRGQNIMKQEPIMCSPEGISKKSENVCCVGCFQILPKYHSTSCFTCGFPVCCHECSREKFHSDLECELYATKRISPSVKAFTYIKFARVLLSKVVFPERYKKFLLLSKELPYGPQTLPRAEEKECKRAWKFLKKKCKMVVTLLEVTDIWIRLKVNRLPIPSQDNTGRRYRGLALFEDVCKLKRSNSANAQWLLRKEESKNATIKWHFYLQAISSIKKGAILSIPGDLSENIGLLCNIANCDQFGDYIVSKKTIGEGKIIIKELPYLTCPVSRSSKKETSFSCVGCFLCLPRYYTMNCLTCRFPVCSSACSKEKFHSGLECKVFSQAGIVPSKEAFKNIQFVRIFMAKTIFPESYKKFQLLSTNYGNGFKELPPGIEEECKNIWKFLTQKCKISVTASEVMNAWLAFRINLFSIFYKDDFGNSYRGCALFEFSSKLSHSCAPSVEWYLEKSRTEYGTIEWRMHLSSRRAIRKGEMLSITYVPRGMDYGTELRKEHFHSRLSFDCICSRCTDATEEGTFFSSPKCSKCEIGYLLPESPLSSVTCSWNCSNCFSVEPGAEIWMKLKADLQYIKPLMKKEVTATSLDKLDLFIEANSGTHLHPNNFLTFQATLYWLLETEFYEVLMEGSDFSHQLFGKIRTRYYQCMEVVSKFMPSMTFVHLEIAMMDAVGAFAFKSENCVAIDDSHLDCDSKLQFSKELLSHLSRALFWSRMQRHNTSTRNWIKMLEKLSSIWSSTIDRYQQEKESYLKEINEKGLPQLDPLSK